jgi:hypothetical protein
MDMPQDNARSRRALSAVIGTSLVRTCSAGIALAALATAFGCTETKIYQAGPLSDAGVDDDASVPLVSSGTGTFAIGASNATFVPPSDFTATSAGAGFRFFFVTATIRNDGESLPLPLLAGRFFVTTQNNVSFDAGELDFTGRCDGRGVAKGGIASCGLEFAIPVDAVPTTLSYRGDEQRSASAPIGSIEGPQANKDGGGDSGASGAGDFGKECGSAKDCSGIASVCGAPQLPYCTAQNCAAGEANEGVCPAGFSCASFPGYPSFCERE